MVGGLTYLVDTNVWLELLLERANAEPVREFLRRVPASALAMSEFTLYSIAIILTRFRKDDVLQEFLADTLENGGVTRIRLETKSLKRVTSVARSLGLEFDDAYQYVAAEEQDLVIVSFDKDFDRTPRGRKSPAQALAG